MATANQKNSRSIQVGDLKSQFAAALSKQKPWDSIADFVTHPSFCGTKYKPYPKQLTLLRLIYLETENMTPFDLETIEEWRAGFGGTVSTGVQPDIWDRVKYLKENGYRRFPHIQSVLGRRASKGWIGGVLGAETIAYMISLDNWQEYYGIQEHKDGYMHALATNIYQAKKFQFADIRDAVSSCRYLDPFVSDSKDHLLHLRTPADNRYIAELRGKGTEFDHEIATIRCLAMTTASASGRGGTTFCNMYDEMAHMIVGTNGPRSAEEVYEAYQPSLAQFGKDQLTYIPSSPFSKIGKFFSLYASGRVPVATLIDGKMEVHEEFAGDFEVDPEETLLDLTADPTMLIIQLPSWALYEDWEKSPSLGGATFKRAVMDYDDPLRRLEKRNPTKFKVEYRGQFAEVENSYLDDSKVEAMFKPFWNDRVLEETPHGRMDIKYHGHVDPGKSKAHFAVSIGHLEDSPEPDEWGNVWPHVIIDYMKVWKAKDYPDNIIDYVEVAEDLKQLVAAFPSLEMFTFDQWNSAGFIAQLKQLYSNRTIIKEVTFSKAANFDRAEQFQNAINLGWIHSYLDNFFPVELGGGSLLEQELKFLTEKNGVVNRQEFGPVTWKDLADCVMEVSARMLKRDLDRWKNFTMGVVPLVSADVSGTARSVDRVSGFNGVRARMDAISSPRRRGIYAPSRSRGGRP